MQSTQVLLSNAQLRLRLQAPVVTAGPYSAVAQAAEDAHGFTWQATAGQVTLSGACRQVEPDEWRIELSLSNTGEAVEVRVAYPYLFYHFAQAQAARIFNPLFGGVLEAANCPFDLAYPGPATFCLTAATGNDAAVAMGVFDAEQRRITIRHIPAAMDGHIRFVLERAQVRHDEHLVLPVQFVKVGRDWAEAMAPYKAWFAQTFHRLQPRPDWWVHGIFTETRKAHCVAPYNPPDAVAGVWIFDDEGHPRTFEQLQAEVDEAVRDGAAHGYLPLFYQFGWWQGMADMRGLFMFDSLCGDYTAAHAVTRRIIDYIHAQGLRTYLYTNAIAAGDESEVFRTHPELFVRDAAGFPVYNAGYPMFMFCPGAPGMRTYWEQVLQTILLDLDADGFFLDQVCGGFPPQYCYATDHQHAHPDTYGQDFLALTAFIARRARELKPDCYVGGELILDTRAVLLDEAHGYGYTGPRTTPPTTLDAQRVTPPAEYYIFTRYLCPEAFSQRSDDLMNGAAGSHALPLWRAHRAIFESEARPCTVTPSGAVAYLFGPVEGAAILAVRAHGEIGAVTITLPDGIHLTGELPEGLTRDGEALSAIASVNPVYYLLSTVPRP